MFAIDELVCVDTVLEVCPRDAHAATQPDIAVGRNLR